MAAAFAPGGALARAEPGFRERAGQTNLAREIARALMRREVLVAEAGTGIGKTFAYLVPLLLAGQRALISTATKSLQDQLHGRDLPQVQRALGVPVTAALLKGRASYLCLHRLKLARQSDSLPERHAGRALARIERWSQQTTSGDLAELDGLDEGSPIVPLVTSTRDNCLGSECPDWRGCHVVRARREAMSADVVVVNHHLFFADLALRETGVAELLPSVQAVVFDEAHHLVDAGVQFLGQSVSTAQVSDLLRDTLVAGRVHAAGLQDWLGLSASCERAMRELRLACAGPLRELRGAIKLSWLERARRPDFADSLQRLNTALGGLAAALETVQAVAPDLLRLHERAHELQGRVGLLAREPDDAREVRWIDLGPHHARLASAPLDIREAMHEVLAAAGRAWVFTSATLGDDEGLRWFTEPAGVESGRTLRVPSPFDYARLSRLWIPLAMPRPADIGHGEAVASLAARCAAVLGGRTFVLTTTLRAMQAIGQAMSRHLEDTGEGIAVLVQGQASKRRLIERFMSGEPAVLVGSQSFWEGIDVPGDALQCVVIDKLPFPPPGDPIVRARVRQLEAQGRRSFEDFHLPEAAVSLKQGAGRLIRTEEDQGLLVLCDPRVAKMAYGRRLLAALPPMTRLDDESQAMDFLSGLRGTAEDPLTTAATTAWEP